MLKNNENNNEKTMKKLCYMAKIRLKYGTAYNDNKIIILHTV